MPHCNQLLPNPSTARLDERVHVARRKTREVGGPLPFLRRRYRHNQLREHVEIPQVEHLAR
jgi:hypothetical protein